MKNLLLLIGKLNFRISFWVLVFACSVLAQVDSMSQQVLDRLETIMKRKLYEKNNLYKSRSRIIDLDTATLYDPVDYFKRFMVTE